MTFVITKPQQELAPIMTQIDTNNSGGSVVGRFYNNSSRSGSSFGSSIVCPSISLTTPSKSRLRKRGSRFNCWCRTSLSIAAILLVLIAVPYALSNFETSVTTSLRLATNQPKAGEQQEAVSAKSVPLVSGTVGDEQIAYYHQPAATPTEENYHVVLLHGAKFTKEDWKTSGILDMFQKNYPSVTLTALDLPVRADSRDLQGILRQMRDEDLIEQLPVSALITPSASGRSISTWITEESSASIEAYMDIWIPVAPMGVSKCSKTNLGTLKSKGITIFPIYGDQDGAGKRVSEKLFQYAGASKVLELPGRHPVYLDSPEAFVKAVGDQVLRLG